MGDALYPPEALKILREMDDDKRQITDGFANGLTPDAADYARLIELASTAREALGCYPDAEPAGPGLGLKMTGDGNLQVATIGGLTLAVGSNGTYGVRVVEVFPIQLTGDGYGIKLSVSGGLADYPHLRIVTTNDDPLSCVGGEFQITTGPGLVVNDVVELAADVSGGLQLSEELSLKEEIIVKSRSYGYRDLMEEIVSMSEESRIEIYGMLKDALD